MKTTEQIISYIERQTKRLFENRPAFFLNKCLIWDYIDAIQAEIHADFQNIVK